MKQIIIPVPDWPGVVADVTGVLGAAGVNIEDLDAGGADENGVIILTVDRYDAAVRALHEAGYRAITEDALVLRIRNEPGALAKVARRLGEASINIRSLRIAKHLGGDTLVTLVAERPEEARELLRDCLVAL
jgi:hypothetical protein